MEKGASQPWQEILQEVTGEGRLDGTALREFFRPLEEWLRQENLRNNEIIGWNYDGDYCKHRSVQHFTDYFFFFGSATGTNPNNYYLFNLFFMCSQFYSIDTANLQVYGGFYNAAPIALPNAPVAVALAFAMLFYSSTRCFL